MRCIATHAAWGSICCSSGNALAVVCLWAHVRTSETMQILLEKVDLKSQDSIAALFVLCILAPAAGPATRGHLLLIHVRLSLCSFAILDIGPPYY